jgi:hypothetical protein
VCFRDVDAILEASLQKADVLEITLQGDGSCSAIFTKHPCYLSSKRFAHPSSYSGTTPYSLGASELNC